MGQTVIVKEVKELDDVLLLDTDRSFTGQDGIAMSPANGGRGVPGALAGELFDLGLGIDHVYVLQNIVTVRRSGGWDGESRAAVTSTVERFLLFYDES